MQNKKQSATTGPVRQSRGLVTRTRILDAAEAIFASHGPGASLRNVMEEAGVNVASVHYYFGTRDVLLTEVIKRRSLTINRMRLKLLREAVDKSERPDPADIVRALVMPALTLVMEGEAAWKHYFQLLGRLENNAGDVYAKIMASYYNRVHFAFLAALAKAYPAIDRDILVWRYYCVVSVMSRAATSLEPVKTFSKGRIDPANADEVFRNMAPGLLALLAAPNKPPR
jgi:AcrR family transcriptional regulator